MEIVEDIVQLSRKMRKTKARIVGVDGSMQSGKSSLVAPAIKYALNARLIHLDHYLRRHGGKYFYSIHFDKLREDIKRALDSYDNVVIEGILLTKVLRHLHRAPEFTIYSCDSFWYRTWEGYAEDRESVKRIIHEEEAMTNRIYRALHPKWRYVRFSRLTKELYEYTHDYKPMAHADCIFIIDKYY